MPLPPDFAAECLYTEDAWFVHDVELFPEESRLVARIDTTRLGHLVNAQRELPNHPKHVPGAVVIQATGTIGHLYAVYALGLRATEGWGGFGTHIHTARFAKLGVIGPEVEVNCKALRARQLRGTWFLRFAFEFRQNGDVIYASEQSAAWSRGG